jgi:rubrerythrin
MEDKEINNALKTAIAMEIKSYQLYDGALKSGKIREKILMETFDFLAKQEKGHIENIKKFAEDCLHKNKKGIKYKIPKHDRKIKSLFGKIIKSKDLVLSKEADKIYRTALAIETSGYNYYKKIMENTKNEIPKSFFKFMTEEENNHYVLLEGTHNFLKNPSLFNAGNESWNFEG